MKPWNQRRAHLGYFDTLLKVLRFENEVEYKWVLRMTPQDFDKLLELVKEYIKKGYTKFRDAIPTCI